MSRLVTARADVRRTVAWALFFGFLTNILLFAPSLYMLQIYDRILITRSVETLVLMSLLLVVGLCFAGVFDAVRSRLLSLAGLGLVQSVQDNSDDALMPPHRAAASNARNVAALLASPAAPSLADLPWVPLFLAALAAIHPALALVALAVAALQLGLFFLRRPQNQPPWDRAEVGSVSLSMPAFATQDVTGVFLRMCDWGAVGRTSRLVAQSAILGTGAWLAIGDAITPGSIVAASILSGRALQPLDALASAASLLLRACRSWAELGHPHGSGAEVPPVRLPTEASLTVHNLTLSSECRVSLPIRGLSFSVKPGECMAVVGPAGTGKSLLLRGLAGRVPWHAGSAELGPYSLSQAVALSGYIGYMPQGARLCPGTVHQNISLGDPEASRDAVLVAAEKAGATDAIARLQHGFDTRLDEAGSPLSFSQSQQVALARAMFGRPRLLLLDEPDSSLDAAGVTALAAALRSFCAEGGMVVVATRRRTTLSACTKVLTLGPNGAVMHSQDPHHQKTGGLAARPMLQQVEAA